MIFVFINLIKITVLYHNTSQDYEYVEGYGDLDRCNGRFGVTPEFPIGIYYYVVTDDFPFFTRCLKGKT